MTLIWTQFKPCAVIGGGIPTAVFLVDLKDGVRREHAAEYRFSLNGGILDDLLTPFR